ncbi:transposase, IS4 family [Anaerobranca californiensis DSM 14826]|jgi:hypothetical protein|uniref:Transposase, IS4 family n=1 Tax=Anaerobranca californiensis DSM 14826 TaxID=1120989 RepID=A0A1M6MXD4_9FIRM|nr:IS4 family transposase [Anaerobranca californiensis]SHJ88105.1 transposase, IS4 family [Anaerobranca californiensis DSM 14826]
MQGKDIINSTFFQLFKPILNEKFLTALNIMDADKYVKKLKTTQLLKLLIISQLEQHRGLRDISNSLKNDELSKHISLNSISSAQLSRRLRDLPVEITETLFKTIYQEALVKLGVNTLTQNLGGVHLIDSTTISLCLSRYPWALFRKTKGGIKLHLRIKFVKDEILPDKSIVTQANLNDRRQMDNLIVEEKDALNIMDRGYVDYKKFDSYCADGVSFICRLKKNAIVEIIEEKAVKPDSNIIKEQIVYLGKDNITKMKHPLRLLEILDSKGKTIVIITNQFELDSEEISTLYRSRWQIELFFKWIKQHLKVKHFYGLSQNAVKNQLLIALITYCLLTILKIKAGYHGNLLKIKRLLHTCLYDSFQLFIKKLLYKEINYSKGRRRRANDLIYEIIERQVMSKEADHLDDLTYDPLVY